MGEMQPSPGPIRLLAAIIALALCAEPAGAQPAPAPADDAQAARIELLQGRKRAEEQEQRGEYQACGRTYLDLYSRASDTPRADELIYNAGVCFETAHLPGLALTAFERLITRHPRSRLAARALLRAANTYRVLIRYDEAAARYEQYARKYGGEHDAPDALLEALTLRKGMGEDAAARKLAELYAKYYARRWPSETVRVVYSVITADERQPRKTIAELDRFLKRWGRKAPDDLVLVANARLGTLLWKQSCKGGADPTGACVRLAQLGKLHRCDSGRAYRVQKRDPRLAARGRKALEHALAIYETLERNRRLPEEVARRAAVDEARARAMFYLAEADYEAFLGLGFPTKLSFSPDKPKETAESTKRLRTWIQEKQELHKKLAGEGGYGSSPKGPYRKLLESRSSAGQWSTAAAARMAQLALAFHYELRGAEIPVDVRTGAYAEDKSHAFCDELRHQAEVFVEYAKASLRVCAEAPGTAGGDRWSSFCQRELETWLPAEFPGQPEIHQRVYVVDPVIDLAPLSRERSQVPVNADANP